MPKFPSPYLLKMWLGGCLVAVKWLFIFYTQISIAFTGGCTATKWQIFSHLKTGYKAILKHKKSKSYHPIKTHVKSKLLFKII
ncbi:hypothetical protein HZ320_00115 [[Pasteurella] aerogenes]|nr:hypothetical protein HZ320_00115 [[Pasteurella] aerogenes]